MKKIVPLLLGACVLNACAKHITDLQTDKEVAGEYSSVIMVIPPCELEDALPQTKNEAIITNKVSFVWSEEDVVGIFPDTGSQIYFSMASGAGQTSAEFDGGGWALKKNAEYFSYFPFIPDFYIDKTSVPISFSGQSQKGNADPAHAYLGNYCYMVAKGTADEATGSLYFNYERIGTLFRFILPVQPGNYKSLSVYIDDSLIAESGTFNAVDIDANINDPVYTDRMTITLEDLSFTESGELVAFMMISPFDILGKGQLNIELEKEDGTVVKSSAVGKTYKRGSTYGIAPNFTITPSVFAVSGAGETLSFDITAANASEYEISTDVSWLTVQSAPTSGSATVNVTAAANTGRARTGSIIISETVTYNGVDYVLENTLTVSQDVNGMDVGLGDWDSDGSDDGGVAE